MAMATTSTMRMVRALLRRSPGVAHDSVWVSLCGMSHEVPSVSIPIAAGLAGALVGGVVASGFGPMPLTVAGAIVGAMFTLSAWALLARR